jgi:CRISPR/Cas system CMR subunit Cmr4 (Cas7 group RAMP superfamily)
MENKERQMILPVEIIADSILEVIHAGGVYKLVVTGYSMSPTLQPNRDSVFLVSTKQRPIKTGEIVFTKRITSGYMLHRVIRIKKDGTYVLNGDGQTWCEEVPPENVLAVVDSIERNHHTISCDQTVYRLYVKIWSVFRPLRRRMVQLKRSIKVKEKGHES